MRVVWVTGTNGFIGSHVVERLISEKSYHVVGLSKGENRLSSIPELEYFEIDLSTDFDSAVTELLPQPDIIVHCAAISQVDLCERDPGLCESINVVATEKLVKIAKEYQAQFIFFSSDFVFDGSKKEIHEHDQTTPISVYGRSKEKAEYLVQSSGLKWSIIRPVLVYGYSRAASRNNIFSWVYTALRNEEKLQIVNDQFRTPTFVMDVVELVSGILNKKSTGIYHIGGNDVVSVCDFAQYIAVASGVDEELIQPKSSDLVSGGKLRPQYSCVNNSKINKEFQMTPLGFKEGILKAIQQIENRGR